jgi:pimeloyl-ACP methyl ester carboxylesterase
MGSMRFPVTLSLFAIFVVLSLASCTTKRPAPAPDAIAPSVLVPTTDAGIIDGRGRFREIFLAVLAARSPKNAEGTPYTDGTTLWKLYGELPATGEPVHMGPPADGYRIVVVPGLLAECVADISMAFGDARKQLQEIGYKMDYIQTKGRRRSAYNADLIRDAVLRMPAEEKIIFVTHSKGTVDTLEALAKYPDVARRTAAVISFSGAVDGSPLAEAFPGFLLKIAHEMPLSSCPPGEGSEAVASLRRNARISWLAAHPLPKNVRYYSLAAFATRENTSRMLRPFYDILAKTDPVNDSMVLCSDAIIPGSTLLGYPNADHWAVAMPVDRRKSPAFAALVDKNEYPREALLEAALRFAEEDLAHATPTSSE